MKNLSQSINFLIKSKFLHLGILILFVCALSACKKNETLLNNQILLQKINLSTDTLNILLGAQAKINFTLSPANTTDTTLTFNSSSPSIVAVQAGGLVTGLKVGTANITISNAASGKAVTCVVNVVQVQATSLQISKTLTMNTGQKDTLTVKLVPANSASQALVWSSSNTAAATVNANGVITAVNAGSTTITVTTSDGKLSASCLVTIVQAQTTSLQISKTLTMNPGQKDTLTVTVVPANAAIATLVWSSSNTAVATVNAAGVITAVIAGSTTVTVSTSDGKLSASCSVTVVPLVNATGIKLDSTQFSLLNGTSLKMGYTSTPVGSSKPNVAWTSDNTTVATVQSDGTINGLTPGNAHITAKTVQGGYTSTCTVSVVTIGYFLENFLNYTSSTATGQLVETVSVGSFNYALYDAQITEIDVYNNENSLIGALKNSSGAPLYNLIHATGGITNSPSQSFIVSQVEPNATTVQNWPVVVYFTCWRQLQNDVDTGTIRERLC